MNAEDTDARDNATAYGTVLMVDVVPCFRAGTLVETDRGPVPVETLRPGDNVLTLSGDMAPITWAGHRRVACHKQPEPERVWPVRVGADAFAQQHPKRELWLSPDHAVYIENVLIPIKHLINGRTIAQIATDEVEYWHIEVDPKFR